ncbi:predicted protein [Nematostella vectensis]|uniref:Potassium channel domain-containing protein n=1 Tax=Nematostella vectensis TaxID=45351 RepID=A7SQQ0_NEMVE|nr:potassium channel subfamily K member 3 [Nematostella vectensis]EDO33949.1 predicted protein [Nematostella vectensis]|eukprot:XP_001626049.1 predicted protein [Nematostella vectensis]
MHQLVKKLLIRSTVLIVYSILSAWLFYELEKQPISNAQTADNMIKSIKLELKTKYNMSENATNRFVESVVQAESVRRRHDWTFARSLFFVCVSLSTIGYGNITPKRAATQVIFIFFCTLGLPIMMLALKTAGEIIAIGLQSVVTYTEKRVFKSNDITAKSLKIKTLVLSMVTSFTTIGIFAVVQSYIEDWTVIESLYAWGVTFTTIGFGDYIPYLSMEAAIELHHGKYAPITSTILTAATLFPSLFLLSLVSCMLTSILEVVEVLKPKERLTESCRRITTWRSRRSTEHRNTGNQDDSDRSVALITT